MNLKKNLKKKKQRLHKEETSKELLDNKYKEEKNGANIFPK